MCIAELIQNQVCIMLESLVSVGSAKMIGALTHQPKPKDNIFREILYFVSLVDKTRVECIRV